MRRVTSPGSVTRVGALSADMDAIARMVSEWQHRDVPQGFSVRELAEQLHVGVGRARDIMRRMIADGRLSPIVVTVPNLSGRCSTVVRYRLSPSTADGGKSARTARQKSRPVAGGSRRAKRVSSG